MAVKCDDPEAGHGGRPARWFPVLAALLLVGLSGCEEEAPAVTERVRSIRAIEVVDRSSGELRTFPAQIRAVDVSRLAFEVPGNTRDVKVTQGDRVRQGEVLATLDPAPYEINVQAAEAEVGRAQAQLGEATTELERQDILHSKGWVARATLEQAQATYQTADNQVRYARSRLNLAKRDLEKTVMVAPFDGVIARRLIEPFQEVPRGKTAFEAYIEGAMEAAIDVPETVVGGIDLGLPGLVVFPTSDIGTLNGRVTEISSSANEANSFEVVVTLEDPPASVRPGMSASVELILAAPDGGSSFLVPLTAVLPGEGQGQGFVFVYDPDSSTVRKQPVAGEGVQDNLIQIREGLSGGEIIATAGVSFLRDGQEVRLAGQ